MKLRPHHLLCTRFYSGHGYSEGFNLKMQAVLTKLKNGEQFTLTLGSDDLCESCPNLSDGICRTQEKVSRYDTQTLLRLGLSDGDTLDPARTKELTDKKIFQVPNVFAAICGDCEWQALCHGKGQ